MTSPNDDRLRYQREQLQRQAAALAEHEAALRQAIASFDEAVGRWQAEFTTQNDRDAKASLVDLSNAAEIYIGHVRGVAVNAGNSELVPAETQVQMWKVVTDLLYELTKVTAYVVNLLQSGGVPTTWTADLPLRPAALDRILANWPQLDEL